MFSFSFFHNTNPIVIFPREPPRKAAAEPSPRAATRVDERISGQVVLWSQTAEIKIHDFQHTDISIEIQVLSLYSLGKESGVVASFIKMCSSDGY